MKQRMSSDYSDKSSYKKEGSGSERKKGSSYKKDDAKQSQRKKYSDDGDFEKKRSFRNEKEGGERRFGNKPFEKRDDSRQSSYKKKQGDDEGFQKKRSFRDEKGDGERRFGNKPFEKRDDSRQSSYKKKQGDDEGFQKKRSFRDEKGDGERKHRSKPFEDRGSKKEYSDKPAKKANRFGQDAPFFDRKQKKEDFRERRRDYDERPPREDRPKKEFKPKKREFDNFDNFEEEGQEKKSVFPMTLNKYIAHSGECGRREAAELVKQGKVRVNGELVLDPGTRVEATDKITLAGKKLTPQKDLVYILMNKPKGFITTTDDPKGRKKVMDLVAGAGIERLYPVGRLDRNTTGLLLITNDGDLAQRLSHPSYNIKKIYQVTLDKALTQADFETILAGVVLEDGKAPVDSLSYLEEKNEIGIEIHSGKNRIVRRIFESLGYVVDKLDRVMYAGLTKKNIARGKWRFLTPREVVLLKHFKQ